MQITTREDTYSKQGTTIKTELEPEAFRPNLSDPSELLQLDQIEKVSYRKNTAFLILTQFSHCNKIVLEIWIVTVIVAD